MYTNKKIGERVKNNAKRIHKHFNDNKRHYHLGILGILSSILGIMIYPDINSLFGDDIGYGTGENLTGGVLTGEYLSGDILTGNALSGDILTGNNLTGEVLTGEYLSGDILTGEALSGDILTGEILSGEVLTGEILTGINLSGSINTGTNSTGTNNLTNLSGNDNTGSQQLNTTGILPLVTGLSININPIISGYIGPNGIVEIKFTSNKILSGIVSTIYGTNADEITSSGLDYTLKLRLTKYNLQGSQNYIISYQDLDGNTGNINGIGQALFDKIGPEFSSLEFTGNVNQVTIKGITNENSLFKITYGYSGYENILSGGTTNYGTSFSHILTGLDNTKIYKFSINFYDIVNNTSSYSGNFYFDQSGSIKLNYIIDSGDQEMTTGTNNIMILQEIKKFNECKEGIKFTEAKATVFDKDYFIQIPNFYDDETKRTVAVLSYDIVIKLRNKNVNDDQINELLKKYNNFLTIIKLVKDDENACKQNFSLYYISRFQNGVLNTIVQ